MRSIRSREAGRNLLRWNLTPYCNYACSYCLTSIVRKEAKPTVLPIHFVDRYETLLNEEWEISLEGLGEPFCAPDFYEVVKELAKKNFFISISTNLSSSAKDIERFICLCGDYLVKIGASLHLEYVDIDEFLDKVIYFNDYIPGKIFVKYVATRAGLRKIKYVTKKLARHQIPILINAERIKDKNDLAHARTYTKKELEIIHSCTQTFWRDLSFEGRLCWTGCKHLVVQEDGRAYRCAPARTENAEKNCMGNIFDHDFKLYTDKKPCEIKNCYCSFSWLDKGDCN